MNAEVYWDNNSEDEGFTTFRNVGLLVETTFHSRRLEYLFMVYLLTGGRYSSVGIATRYGLEGPGIEPRWYEIFRTCPNRPWGLPNFLYSGYRDSSPGIKRPGRGVDHPPHLLSRLKKEYSCTCSPPLGLGGLFWGELYLYLFIYKRSIEGCATASGLFGNLRNSEVAFASFEPETWSRHLTNACCCRHHDDVFSYLHVPSPPGHNSARDSKWAEEFKWIMLFHRFLLYWVVPAFWVCWFPTAGSLLLSLP